MQIQFDEERKQEILDNWKRFTAEHFDDVQSDFRSDLTLKFFVDQLGPAIYNQAIQDARAFMQQKVDDLDVEFYVDGPE